MLDSTLTLKNAKYCEAHLIWPIRYSKKNSLIVLFIDSLSAVEIMRIYIYARFFSSSISFQRKYTHTQGIPKVLITVFEEPHRIRRFMQNRKTKCTILQSMSRRVEWYVWNLILITLQWNESQFTSRRSLIQKYHQSLNIVGLDVIDEHLQKNIFIYSFVGFFTGYKLMYLASPIGLSPKGKDVIFHRSTIVFVGILTSRIHDRLVVN